MSVTGWLRDPAGLDDVPVIPLRGSSRSQVEFFILWEITKCLARLLSRHPSYSYPAIHKIVPEQNRRSSGISFNHPPYPTSCLRLSKGGSWCVAAQVIPVFSPRLIRYHPYQLHNLQASWLTERTPICSPEPWEGTLQRRHTLAAVLRPWTRTDRTRRVRVLALRR